MILELCKGVHCVDLGESFQTHIYLQNLASIQPRTSPLKFAASREPRSTLRTGANRAEPAGSDADVGEGGAADLSRVQDPTNFRGLVLGCIEAKSCK